MNDLETALRDTLRARVTAAERPSDLLPGVRKRARRLKARRTIVASALATAAVLALSIIPLSYYALTHLAFAGPASVPMTNPPSVTPTPTPQRGPAPRGWSPVAYRGVRISVPRSWAVQRTPGCPGPRRGVVYVAVTAKEGCIGAPNVIVISRDPQARTAKATAAINGIRVLFTRTGGVLIYVLPAFGIEIRATGPEAGRVMATLADDGR
jgi:hypothetical protein